jgi:hypothetical protein
MIADRQKGVYLNVKLITTLPRSQRSSTVCEQMRDQLLLSSIISSYLSEPVSDIVQA